MSSKDADFTTWIERHPPPSLKELIKEHGSYGAIPKRAWRTSKLNTRIGRNNAKRVCGEHRFPHRGRPKQTRRF
jgi:hypothetical protein